MTRTAWLTCLLLAPAALTAQGAPRPAPPAELLGRFMDDYGGRYTITDSLWRHGSRARYHIVEWNVTERYFIARNDTANPSEPGLWTRIDWMAFTGMAPWNWGFCMTAYAAPTADSARATKPADREHPKTGCNKFPFSRMQRDTT